MDLNMHMIEQGLSRLSPKGVLRSSPLERPLARTLPYEPAASYAPDAVYICRASELDKASYENAAPRALVCCGKPPAPWLDTCEDILYVPARIGYAKLFAVVADTFTFYYRWECDLSDALAEDAPLERFGAVSRSVITNPFFITSEGFKILLHEAAVLKQEDPQAYRDYCKDMGGGTHPVESGSYASIDIVRELVANPATQQAFAATDPWLYTDPAYAYDTLTFNLGPASDRMGTLCMDGVLHGIRPLDYTLITVLGKYLERALRKKNLRSPAKTEEFAKVLYALLSHTLVSERRIESVLDRLGYDMHDDFACLAVHVQSGRASARVLESLAPAIAHQLPTDCYYQHGETAVFVANLSILGDGLDGIAHRMEPMLQENYLIGGLSRAYGDFKNLYWFFCQAEFALGCAEANDSTLVRYEDCCLLDCAARVRAGAPGEALAPEGLRLIRAYDAAHSTQLTELLRIYLDCDRNIAETCRTAFLARNTCIRRLERIRKISALNLENPDERLKLQIALRLGQKRDELLGN